MIKHNGAPTGDEPTIAKSFSRLAHDAIELGELQAQLLTLDAQELGNRLRTALVLGAIALIVLLGTVPMALLALAEVLVGMRDWSRPAAVASATGVGVLVAAVLAALCWRWVARCAGSLNRSRDELRRNICWLKTSLRQSTVQGHGEQK